MKRRDFVISSMASLAGTALGRPAPAQAAGRPHVLDFRQDLPQLVQFRRSSRASQWDDAQLTYVERDRPRFMRQGGRALGLLLEASGENLLSPSCLDSARWHKEGMECTKVTTLAAPDGSRALAQLTRPARSKSARHTGLAKAPAGATLLTASVWLRSSAGTGSWGLMLRDTSSFNVCGRTAAVSPAWQRQALTLDGFLHDQMQKSFSLIAKDVQPVDARPEQRISGAQVAPGLLPLASVYAWGAQLELGATATSYMPDGSRAADELECAATLLDPEAGSLSFELPLGGTRGGVLLDAEGATGGLYLGYNLSGQLEARVGALSLLGGVDATAHTWVRLEWQADRGAQLWAGAGPTRSVPMASVSAPFPALALTGNVRLATSRDGSRALNAPLARVEIGERPRHSPRPVPAPSYPPPRYELCFADDFDHGDLTRINEDALGGSERAPAWRSRYRHARSEVINKEKQIYMDPRFAGTADHALGVQPFSIEDGVLRITAERADPVGVTPFIWGHRYTSGCISSELTHWQRYGYFEMRARLPRGKGFWPAFWLLPKAAHWPPEIDVFEASGMRPFAFRPAFLPPRGSAQRNYGCWIRQAIAIDQGFHVYGMEWTADDIQFFVDGRPCYQTGPHDIHEEMYLLANLALGSHDSNWIPDPDASTPFPGKFEIDYIRAYRRAGTPKPHG